MTPASTYSRVSDCAGSIHDDDDDDDDDDNDNDTDTMTGSDADAAEEMAEMEALATDFQFSFVAGEEDLVGDATEVSDGAASSKLSSASPPPEADVEVLTYFLDDGC